MSSRYWRAVVRQGRWWLTDGIESFGMDRDIAEMLANYLNEGREAALGQGFTPFEARP